MNNYVCAEVDSRSNIYGNQNCKTWVVQQSFVDEFAITKEQAAELTIAICILFVIAYVGGLIGRAMMQV